MMVSCVSLLFVCRRLPEYGSGVAVDRERIRRTIPEAPWCRQRQFVLALPKRLARPALYCVTPF